MKTIFLKQCPKWHCTVTETHTVSSMTAARTRVLWNVSSLNKTISLNPLLPRLNVYRTKMSSWPPTDHHSSHVLYGCSVLYSLFWHWNRNFWNFCKPVGSSLPLVIHCAMCDYDCITMNWILIGLNWRCIFEMPRDDICCNLIYINKID